MSLPYGMLAGQGMDPRALSAGNLPYPYGNPMIYFQNFAGYGQAQRSKNSEETSGSNKCSNPSSQLRLVLRIPSFSIPVLVITESAMISKDFKIYFISGTGCSGKWYYRQVFFCAVLP